MKKKTGFALLSEERKKEIASLGGKTGAGHKYDSKEAKRAVEIREKKKRKKK